ncbi:MAG: 30S ribosomal protein S3 [Chloroflexi bacterium]|nr:MAG: 30S ribosomal protein S3 [Chloroflexota bacterium]
MGRKVHPYGFRLGGIKDWRARWYAGRRQFKDLLHEDIAIRNMVMDQVNQNGQAGVSDVEIDRYPNKVSIAIHTAKPGIIIGRKGEHVNRLRNGLEHLTGKKVHIDVKEIQHPEVDAQLVAESIAGQLERRVAHKRAMKQAAQRAMKSNAHGIKIVCAGRLAGSEMARRDKVIEGSVPLHTLRADIDYAQSEALTTYGRIGVKVWINKGEVLPPTAEEIAARIQSAEDLESEGA